MNRNRKCSKKVAAGIAVGMAAVMSAVPVLAAEEAASVSKEETVYVNADEMCIRDRFRPPCLLP